jgi:nucleoid-associated protein YgaU
MGTIKYWLYNGKEKLQLPVNPESLSNSSPFGFTDVEVAQLGEVTVPGTRQLTEYSLTSFFPSIYNPVYCEYTNIPKPWDAVNLIEKWRDKKTPIRFAVTGTPINVEVTIREFDKEIEKGGNPGDIYYSLTLKKYATSTPQKLKSTPAKAKPAPVRSGSKSSVPKTYTVKKGDSLWKIAIRYYGKSEYWRKIYDKNKKLIGKNPNKIYPGQKLVMP